MDDGGFVRFLPWMFMAFGVILAGGSLWIARRETRGRHWREVEGRITGFHSYDSRNYEGMVSTLHRAEIEYRLPGLPPARFLDDVGTGDPPEVGGRVRLRYNPDDHGEVMVWAPARLGIFYVAFFLMGLTLIAGGVFALYIGPS